jgi:hypothetical protein
MARHRFGERPLRHLGLREGGGAGRADDVLVSRTVKDLVAGSGIKFEDFGMHSLKGIPEAWQVFRAIS